MLLGGVLTALDALGPAPASDWTGARPDGNDFRVRHAEDLGALVEAGVSAVRLGFDWARLEPTPGRVDDDWREWYEHVLTEADREGVAVWATLHETSVPRWFDDEGSFGDERAAGRWWPRWVERAAELFGDRVAGWFPIHDPVGAAGRWAGDPHRHEDALVHLAVAWRDAWRILRGGPPVATSLLVRVVRAADQTVPAAQAARREDHLRWRLWCRALRDGVVVLPGGRERRIADLAGALDTMGVATALDLPEGRVTDESLRRWEERLGTILRRAAEDGPERPLVLSGLSVTWPSDEERRLLVEAAARAVDVACADGVPLTAVFVDPAIAPAADRESTAGALISRDREMTDSGAVWATLGRPATN